MYFLSEFPAYLSKVEEFTAALIIDKVLLLPYIFIKYIE